MKNNPSTRGTDRKTTAPASRSIDYRTAGIMLGAALLGAAWAVFNLVSTGGARSEAELRELVWAIFATPFALFIGWTVARRFEVWRAAGICFCLYFFTPFVAARFQSLVWTEEQAAINGNSLYFWTAIVLHLLGAVGLAVWRALDQPDQEQTTSEQTVVPSPGT
jgi:cation transport ATPase